MIRSLALPLIALAALHAPAAAQSRSERYAAAAIDDARQAKLAAEMVLASTRDPLVKRYARVVFGDSSRTEAEVRAAAYSAGLFTEVANRPVPGSAYLSALAAVDGPARDRVYRDQQPASHEATLALHRAYAARRGQAQLVDAAARTVPLIEYHGKLLRSLP